MRDPFGPDTAEVNPDAPKAPETGARLSGTVAITFRQDTLDEINGYDSWPYTYTISSSEALKLRDALNALEL